MTELNTLPPLPPGFTLDPVGGEPETMPPLPPGFTLDEGQPRFVPKAGAEEIPPPEPNIAIKGRRAPLGTFGSRVESDLGRAAVTQGALFGFGDELMSGMGAVIESAVNKLTGKPANFSESFQQRQAYEAALLAATRERHPALAPTAEIAGGLATGGAGGAKVLAQLATKTGKVLGGIGLGAGAGAAQGFGTGDDLEERVDLAKTGAAFGAGIGAALPMVGAGAGAIAKLLKPEAKRLAKKLGVRRGTLKRIQQGFDDSVNTGTLRKAQRPEDPLFALSPRLTGQAETIAQRPEEAGTRILNATYARAEGSGGRIQDAIDEGLRTNEGRVFLKQALKDERKAAGKMYNAARAFDEKDGTLFDVTALKDEIAANSSMLEVQGRAKFSKFINDFASADVGVSNAETLHMVRQMIDDETRVALRAGATNFADVLRNLRAPVDASLKRIKGWRAADKAFQVAKQKEKAFDAGRGAFQRNALAPDELAKELDEMEPPVRESFARGARDAISQLMGTSRNDAGATIRELLEKGWNRERLAIIIGNKGRSAKLLDTLDREKRIASSLQRIAANSATTRRTLGQEEFPLEIGGADISGFHLGTSSIVRRVTFNMANKIFAATLGKRFGKISNEASKLLTATGLKRDQVIRELTRLKAERGGKALKRAEIAEALANMMVAPGAAQTGQAPRGNAQ